jgi:hypothetical protein
MSNQVKAMNCEDYKKALSINPAESSDATAVHASECRSCARYRDELRALDERIARALAIPVPDLVMPELADLGAIDNMRELPRRRMTVPVWFGMAAGLVLVAYFGLTLTSTNAPQPTLAEQVIAHMDHEQSSRVVTNVAVPERTLQNVVSKDVAVMDPGIGLITYAHSCVINGHTIPHLVIQGEKGPVTLLLLPDEPIDGPIELHGENINGIILPVGNGSIAIMGARDERIDEVGTRVVDAVKWST